MGALGALAPRRLLPRTLRSRLIAGLMALLFVACAAIGLVTYLTIQGSLSNELNNELQTATGLAYNCWEQQVSQEKTSDDESGKAEPPTGQAPASDASPPATTASTSPLPERMGDCPGLGEDTFVAVVWHD